MLNQSTPAMRALHHLYGLLFLEVLTLLIYCWVLFPQKLTAQDIASLQFDQLSMAEGLSAYPVTSILQDRNGYLWVGTVDGLNRYDGYSFITYRHIPGDSSSLSGNYINVNALLEDENGNIWIGTRSGLNRLDPITGAFERFYHDPDKAGGLSSSVVTSLQLGEAGSIWIGTVAGLNKYDPVSHTIFPWRLPDTIEMQGRGLIYDIARDSAGVIWLAMRGGLFSLDLETTEGKRWQANNEKEQVIHSAHTLLLDDAGDLWTGWSNGMISRMSRKRDAFVTFDLLGADRSSSIQNFVLDIHRDDAGNLWVGVWDYGLVLLNPDTGSRQVYQQDIYEEDSLPGNRVSVVKQDRTGLMWIGTWDGLARIKPYQRFNHLGVQKEDRLKLSFPRATSVAVGNDGDLWIGTQGGGVNHLDASLNQIRVFRHDPNDASSLGADAVSSVLLDHEGMVWIGTEGGGLSRLDPNTGMMKHYRANPADTNSLGSNYIYKVFEDSNHRLWIGTVNAGLNLFDRDTGRFHRFLHEQGNPASLASNEVWTVFEDSQGTLWVGTINGGLHRVLFEKASLPDMLTPSISFDRFQHDPLDPGSLNSNNVVNMTEDTSGNLLIGTMGGGLNRLNQGSGKFDSWSITDGLTSENIGCILIDNSGLLWAGTSTGISRFDTMNQDYASFSTADGLGSSFFFFDGCAKGSDGTLYFAGDRGVSFFDPEVIYENEIPPKVVITGLEVHNRAVETDSLVAMKKVWRLDHNQNAIRLRFAALDYTISHQNAYKHKLEGVDQDWVKNGVTRFASYANLVPGHYKFRVLGSNNSGVWSENEVVLDIIIAPAFYQTIWFKTMAGLLLLAILAGGYSYKEVQRRRIEETRKRIADDLHDDLGSRLSGIALYFESLLRRKEFTEQDRNKIKRYGSQSRMLVSDLRDMIWVIDSGSDGLHGLVDRMQEVAFHMSTEANISVNTPSDMPDIKLSMGQRRNMVFILKEALHNAVKHAEASAISVQVEFIDGTLRIEVQDNGKGYNPADIVEGRGTKTMASRAASINASLNVNTKVAEGTSILLAIKMT